MSLLQEVETFATEVKGAVVGEAEKVADGVKDDLKPFLEHKALDADIVLGKAKIAALDALTETKTEALTLLEAEKARVLGDVAALRNRAAKLLSDLALEVAF